MAIVLKKQIQDRTDRIESKYLYQGELDQPIYERRIYSLSKKLGIISDATFSKLDMLYSERNKVIHRYVISRIKTIDLYNLVYQFELVCETVRESLRIIEDIQVENGIGIYGKSENIDKVSPEQFKNYIEILHSQINDKHFIEDFYRR